MVREFNKNNGIRDHVYFKNTFNLINKYKNYKEAEIELVENKLTIYIENKFEGQIDFDSNSFNLVACYNPKDRSSIIKLKL